MEFKTKEEYERRINNSYIDYSPNGEFSGYSRPERHFIYPKYDVFDKNISQDLNMERFVHDLFSRSICSAIFAQGEQKPVEYLNSEEKLGVCVGAGIPMKWENGKFTTLYDVGILLIDGEYKVFYKIPKSIHTY